MQTWGFPLSSQGISAEDSYKELVFVNRFIIQTLLGILLTSRGAWQGWSGWGHRMIPPLTSQPGSEFSGVKGLVQGHTAGEWQSHRSPDVSFPNLILVVTLQPRYEGQQETRSEDSEWPWE